MSELPPEIDRALSVLMGLIEQFAFQSLGNHVLSGPFQGMELPLPDKMVWKDTNSSGKLLGCYEQELHAALVKAIARKPRLVINIGCAEGYYAIGLARALPTAEVYAFDISTPCLNVAFQYARRNQVAERIYFMSGCRKLSELSQRLITAPPGHRLYVVDCEGFENNLLDPRAEPAFASADVIVECHDFLATGTQEVLMERFAATHEIEVLPQMLPNLNAFPEIFVHASTVFRALVLTERRPIEQSWLAMWSKTGG